VSREQPPVGGSQPRVPVVLTCEHASNAVPAGADFDPALLATHRGWDEGALELAQQLGAALGVEVLAGRWSRLWVDLNRDGQPGHPWDDDWAPWRAEARRRMQAAIDRFGRVLHVSVHTFTPELDPGARTYPLGVLYDPARSAEVAIADALVAEAGAVRNAPYLGVDEGHTTSLRTVWPDPVYAGVELELNQGRRDAWPAVMDAVARVLAA